MACGFRRGGLSAGKDSIVAALCWAALLGLAPAVQAEEEWLFDQRARIVKDREFARKFPNSRYVATERRDVIERGAATITFSGAGCVHLGITIDHAGPAGAPAVSRARVFRRVVALVREFGGGELVAAEAVSKAFERGRYARQASDGGAYFFVGVASVTAFEVSYAVANGRLKIRVSYYI